MPIEVPTIQEHEALKAEVAANHADIELLRSLVTEDQPPTDGGGEPPAVPEDPEPPKATIEAESYIEAGESTTFTVRGAERVYIRVAWDGGDLVDDYKGLNPDEPFTREVETKRPGKITIEANPDAKQDEGRYEFHRINVNPEPGTVPRPVTDWKTAIESAQDGGVVKLSGSYTGDITLKDKKSITIKAATHGKRPVLHGQLIIGGTLEGVTIEGIEIKPPIDDGEPVGPGVTLMKGGKYARIDGLLFDDCKFNGGTFGVALNIMEEHRAAGYFMRTIGFSRCIFDGQFRKSWLRSSGFNGDFITTLIFASCAGIRCGRNDLHGGKATGENQFLYIDTNNSGVGIDNLFAYGISACPAQVRTYDGGDFTDIVWVGCGGQFYQKAGSIDRFLGHDCPAEFERADNHLVKSYNVHDSGKPPAKPVKIGRGLVSRGSGMLKDWGGGVYIDGNAGKTDDNGLDRKANSATFTGDGTCEIDGWGDRWLVVDGKLVGPNRPLNKRARYVDPNSIDWEAAAEANANRGYGEWNDDVHGAKPHLKRLEISE